MDASEMFSRRSEIRYGKALDGKLDFEIVPAALLLAFAFFCVLIVPSAEARPKKQKSGLTVKLRLSGTIEMGQYTNSSGSTNALTQANFGPQLGQTGELEVWLKSKQG